MTREDFYAAKQYRPPVWCHMIYWISFLSSSTIFVGTILIGIKYIPELKRKFFNMQSELHFHGDSNLILGFSMSFLLFILTFYIFSLLGKLNYSIKRTFNFYDANSSITKYGNIPRHYEEYKRNQIFGNILVSVGIILSLYFSINSFFCFYEINEHNFRYINFHSIKEEIKPIHTIKNLTVSLRINNNKNLDLDYILNFDDYDINIFDAGESKNITIDSILYLIDFLNNNGIKIIYMGWDNNKYQKKLKSSNDKNIMLLYEMYKNSL